MWISIRINNILLEIPIAFGIAYFIWYLTTRKDRNNRKYVRNMIVENYQSCWVAIHAVIHNPNTSNTVVNMLSRIPKFFDDNIELTKSHSHY